MVAFLEKGAGAVGIVVVVVVVVVALMILILVSLIRPIVAPTIVAFPWEHNNTKHKEKTTVILAGSYNPPHLGHLAMLQYLAKRCVNVPFCGVKRNFSCVVSFHRLG